MAARDHRVRIKDREAIARIAMAWWVVASKLGHSFNICTFITDILAERLRYKGKLQIKFYSSERELPERAYVTFNPLTLHIVETIWRDAGLGIPYARYILAHETGHIVLHDEFAVAFSDDKAAQLKYLQNEESVNGRQIFSLTIFSCLTTSQLSYESPISSQAYASSPMT